MILQQPFRDALIAADSVLLVGAGGGYDVFGAVPLFVDLAAMGKTAHFAGVSFTSLDTLPGLAPHPEHAHLYPVTGSSAVSDAYCPEAWLARWLETKHGYSEPVWALERCGARPLRESYSWLVKALDVDALVLVDGGVDLLLQGDEASIGTPAEDLCSLAALDQVTVATKVVGCFGFGTQLREGIRHAQVLERIADLSRAGAFLGAGALLPQTAAGTAYAGALQFAFSSQPPEQASHVHSVVLAAMRGEFGSTGPDVWVSPLAQLFWFFSMRPVAQSHLFLKDLLETESIFDATAIIRACRKSLASRPAGDMPL